MKTTKFLISKLFSLFLGGLLISLNVACDDSSDDGDCTKPDLLFQEVKVICPPNENYQIGWEGILKNTGQEDANSAVQAWLSVDDIIDATDKAAGGLVVAVNAESSKSFTFGATVGDTAGYNYLILEADSRSEIDECNEDNNISVIKIPENYPEELCEAFCDKPDFVFEAASIICPTSQNNQIGWEVTIKNIGKVDGETSVQAWLSMDEQIDTTDDAAGGRITGVMSANGGTSSFQFGATVPCSTCNPNDPKVQDYNYLILQIDHNSETEECDEDNNIHIISIPKHYPDVTCNDCYKTSFEEIKSLEKTLSSLEIIATDFTGFLLKPEDVIFYKTNKGRLGKLIIKNIEPSEDYKLTFNAITYNADGTIYKEKLNITVRGTWLVDLDELIETPRDEVSTRDFWWKRINNKTTYFTPVNDAKFAFCAK